MRNAPLTGKALVRGFQSFMISFTSTENGRIVSSKAIDEVMEDIFGKKKVLERVCRCESIQDLKSIFFGIDFAKICDFFASEDSLAIINELILLDIEIRNLTSRYTKLSKKGGNKKKRDKIKQSLGNRKKKYKKVVKSLREELNIFDDEREIKFKDKYKSLDKYLEKRDDPYYYIFDDMDDYDDEEFDDDAKMLLGGRPRAYRNTPDFRGINAHFAQFMNQVPVTSEDDDLDDMDDLDDDDELEDDIREKVDMLQEQNANILSVLSTLVSQMTGGIADTSENTILTMNPDEIDDVAQLRNMYSELTKVVGDMQKNQRLILTENQQLSTLVQQLTISDGIDPDSCDDVSDLMDALLTESEDSAELKEPSPQAVTGVGLAEDDSEDDRPSKKTFESSDIEGECSATADQISEDPTNLNTSQLIDKVNDEKGGKNTNGRNFSKNKPMGSNNPNAIE